MAIKAADKKHDLQFADLGTYVGSGQNGQNTQWVYRGWTVPNPEKFTKCRFSSDDPSEQKRNWIRSTESY